MLGMANEDCSFITVCNITETQSLLSLINEQVCVRKKNNTLISTIFILNIKNGFTTFISTVSYIE